MMMTDDKKVPAAYYIEDRAKCNVFQRMTTFIGRLVDDYRIQIMKCGRVLPKAIRGKKLNLRSLIDNKNVDFIYSVNA